MFEGRGEDEATFVAFVRTERARLLEVAWLMSHDHALAEDLVQEALTKVGLRWRRLRDQAPVMYARRILYRDLISHLRRAGRQTLVETPAAYDRPGPDNTSPVPIRLGLGALLDALPPRQRAVLVLRFYEDLTISRVADVLGVSEGTVKSQTHHALAALRRLAAADDQEAQP